MDPALHKIARGVWRRFGLDVTLAALARVYALYLVNQLYGFLGVFDKTGKYAAQYDDYKRRCRKMLGEEAFDDTLNSPNTDLAILDESWRLYSAGTDEYANLLRDAGKRRWLQEFVAFAQFIAGIRHDAPTPAIPQRFRSDNAVTPVHRSRDHGTPVGRIARTAAKSNDAVSSSRTHGVGT